MFTRSSVGPVVDTSQKGATPFKWDRTVGQALMTVVVKNWGQRGFFFFFFFFFTKDRLRCAFNFSSRKT